MKATEVKESKIWWSGPVWISDRQNWPETNEVAQTECNVIDYLYTKKIAFQLLNYYICIYTL